MVDLMMQSQVPVGKLFSLVKVVSVGGLCAERNCVTPRFVLSLCTVNASRAYVTLITSAPKLRR